MQEQVAGQNQGEERASELVRLEAEEALAQAQATAWEESGESEATTASESTSQPAEPAAGAAWYVVHTYSGYENKVKRNLEHRVESMGMQDQIFQVIVPVEEEVDIREGQRRIVERKIFPGYILVKMVMNDQSWSLVRHTPGVTGFVGSGTRPTPLSKEDMERILQRMETEEPKVRVSFRKGQSVRIIDGPFTDFHGIVDDIDTERGKVRLLVSFFGRETPIELDFLQVEKG